MWDTVLREIGIRLQFGLSLQLFWETSGHFVEAQAYHIAHRGFGQVLPGTTCGSGKVVPYGQVVPVRSRGDLVRLIKLNILQRVWGPNPISTMFIIVIRESFNL